MPFSRQMNSDPAAEMAMLQSLLGEAVRQRDAEIASAPLAGPEMQTAGLFDMLFGRGQEEESLNPFDRAGSAMQKAQDTAAKQRRAKRTSRSKESMQAPKTSPFPQPEEPGTLESIGRMLFPLLFEGA